MFFKYRAVFLSARGRESLFRGEVWVCNTAKADYFGGVVPHPEWVLDDLKSLMDGKESGPHGLFARLKTNPEGR